MTDPHPTSDSAQTEQFVRLLTQHNRRLYGYILALLPHRSDADEVLQETSTFLWRNFSQFRPGTDFASWACRAAYFKVLEFRQRQRRDRLIFSDETVSLLADEAQALGDVLDLRQRALADCLERLGDRDRELVRLRYAPQATVASVAAEVRRSVDAVYKALNRIHGALLECIQRRLAAAERMS